MTTIIASGAMYESARAHLRGHVEQVGFFLAGFDSERNAFALREWRPMPPDPRFSSSCEERWLRNIFRT